MADATLTPLVRSRPLQRVARTRFDTPRSSWSAFEVSGYVGLAVAVAVALALVPPAGLSAAVVVGLVGLGATTFLALTAAGSHATGRPHLSSTAHSGAVMLVAAAGLAVTGHPALPYLDVVAVALCAFLACGRVGCLMVGCCHGRPGAGGITYGPEHAADGFPAHYVGVPLFPVQAVEAAWMLGLAVLGTVLVAGGARAGVAVTSCVVGFALGRAVCELGRGDAERTLRLNLSTAQWAGGATAVLVIAFGAAGVLPVGPVHVLVAVAVVVVIAGTAVWSAAVPQGRLVLCSGRHLREIARALALQAAPVIGDALPPPGAPSVPVVRTSRGIRLSSGRHHDGDGVVTIYTLSSVAGDMSPRTAATLARTILLLRHPVGAAVDVVAGRHATFHLIVRDSAGPGLPA